MRLEPTSDPEHDEGDEDRQRLGQGEDPEPEHLAEEELRGPHGGEQHFDDAARLLFAHADRDARSVDEDDDVDRDRDGEACEAHAQVGERRAQAADGQARDRGSAAAVATARQPAGEREGAAQAGRRPPSSRRRACGR